MSLTANDIWTNVYTESGHVVAAKKCVWGVGAASPTGWPTNLDLKNTLLGNTKLPNKI